MRLVSVLLALLAAACSPIINQCAKDSVLVSITLSDAATAADSLGIDVAIDNGAPMHTNLPHTQGLAKGAVEIDFPSGYPAGKSVTITVTAKAGATVIATQAATVMLTSACASTAITVGTITTADLRSPMIDQGLRDQSLSDLTNTDDLIGVDLVGSTADLVGNTVDLTPNGADLTCVPAQENCFNGVDDDCDGLIDCADPECTSGSTPTAVCVADPGASGAGTQLSGPSSCPTSYPQKTPIGAGYVDSSCNTGNCSVGGSVTGACHIQISDYGAGSFACSGTTGGTGAYAITASSDQSCPSFTPMPSTSVHFAYAPEWQLTFSTCSIQSGSAQKVPASFTTNDTFCGSTAPVGGGCATGNVCVPSAAKHCTLVTGASAACPTGYVKNATAYFAGITQNKVCSCLGNSTDGTCDASGVTLEMSSDCGDLIKNSLSFNTCDNTDYSSYSHLIVAPPITNGACFAQVTTLNTDAPSDARTLCCAP